MTFSRPDEIATESQIRKNLQEEQRFRNVGKTAVGLATGASLTGIGAKIAPFLNKYIPSDLAVKGISKISPQLGNILKKGQSMGLDIEEGLNFVKDQFLGSKKQEPAKQNLNIIEQESPELFKFIDQEIRNGRKPIEAAALAQNDKRFMNIIKKLMKTHNASWSSIIESIFGSGEQALPNTQQNPVNAQQPTSNVQQQAPNTQQPGQGQAALMAILQKIQQDRGGGQ